MDLNFLVLRVSLFLKQISLFSLSWFVYCKEIEILQFFPPPQGCLFVLL